MVPWGNVEQGMWPAAEEAGVGDGEGKNVAGGKRELLLRGKN